MPFTEKQRRYFHAAAERGEQGMTGLASEADKLAKAGKERSPVKEHVEHYANGGMACKYCGGEVEDDGYAREMKEQETPDGGPEEFIEGEGNEDTVQSMASQRNLDAAFADTIKRRRGGG
jgi:hypothetical protein